MTASETLRKLIEKKDMLRVPGVFDGVSAHVARSAGFGAVYLTGAGSAAFGYGLPDIGLVTQTEMTDRARHIVEAAVVPVIADADTGFGAPRNVTRTIRQYEQAGVAAVQLEDQTFPKHCGHLNGKEVVSTEDFLRTLDAALNARRSDTLIVARTDSLAPAGIDEAINRARRYANAGADLIFVEAPQTVEQVERIATEISAPLLFNVVPGGRTPPIADSRLQELGFAMAIYPSALMMPAANAMLEAAAEASGQQLDSIDSPSDLFRLVGMDSWVSEEL